MEPNQRKLAIHHLLALVGGVLPAGECWLPGMLFRRQRQGDAALNTLLAHHLWFQGSWLILRWLVLVATTLIVFGRSALERSAQTEPHRTDQTKEFSIPGESGGDDPHATDDWQELSPREQRHRAFDFRADLSQARRRLLLETRELPEMAGFVLQLMVGVSLFILIWLTGQFVTAMNFIRLLLGKDPVYPLNFLAWRGGRDKKNGVP